MGMKQEPQIFHKPPEWTRLEELYRTEDAVWFKTKYGKKRWSLKDVEGWEERH